MKNQVLQKLAFFFNPTPDTPFIFQNHFIYFFCSLLLIGIYLIIKKPNLKRFGKLLRNYALIGLFFVFLRYENTIFFSMRAIFTLFIILSTIHIIHSYFWCKKDLRVKIETQKNLSHIYNPYIPTKKSKKAKKRR